jgi:WD40 repeat protein
MISKFVENGPGQNLL